MVHGYEKHKYFSRGGNMTIRATHPFDNNEASKIFGKRRKYGRDVPWLTARGSFSTIHFPLYTFYMTSKLENAGVKIRSRFHE